MRIVELLNWAKENLERHGIENPRLNAELLLARSLRLSKEGIFVHLYDSLEEEAKKDFKDLIGRRISGEPLQYILGHQEFWSIDFKVDPRVLIPRPETELLVEQAVQILKGVPSKRSVVLDMGTGSGAVAIALAKEIKNIFLVASDISLEALILAQENARAAGVFSKIEFINSNLMDPFRTFSGREPFDLILSNPPYIICSEIEGLAREVKHHEPHLALCGGEDGLDFYRSILAQASSYLKNGGWLLLEMGQGQHEAVLEMIEGKRFFKNVELIQDLSGIERVIKAQEKRE